MNTIQETLLSTVDLTNNGQVPKVDVGAKFANVDQGEKADIRPVQADTKVDSVIEQSEEFFAEIKDNLQKINDFIPVQSTNLVFEFDELGDPPVVKVVDKGSDEVIREIPSQEFREVAKAIENLADKLTSSSGILFNDSV